VGREREGENGRKRVRKRERGEIESGMREPI
jgi:hypothetical protein